VSDRPTLAVALLALLAALACGGCSTEAIEVYQRHLGDQWAFHCRYQPSCSQFGKESVEQYGSVAGSLMTADRLMRDHELDPDEYDHDERGRPLDPPRDDALFGPKLRDDDSATLVAMRARDDQETQRPPLAADFDEAQQLAFADRLFDEREFELARVEYLRLVRHRPDSVHAWRCHERIALCLAKADRRHDALGEVDHVTPLAERERTRALVYRELDEPQNALDAARSGGSPLLTGLLALEAERSDVARDHFARVDLGGGDLRDRLLERTDAFDALPRKSRWLAGSLSAVLPGSGQVYAGRPADGAVAFLVNSVLIGGTVVAARRHENVTAGALGFVAFGFYTGNVYGAVNAAAKHDRAEEQTFLARMRGWLRQSNFWASVAPDGDGGALGLYFRF
jgi:putative component of membrane protein insertase Oxa1/YidC/SpoIIIJ protein YidD